MAAKTAEKKTAEKKPAAPKEDSGLEKRVAALEQLAQNEPAAPAEDAGLEARVKELEAFAAAVERFIIADLNATLHKEPVVPGGPAGDGAGEEQIAGPAGVSNP